MSDVALRMEHVYKKFRKGEIYDSLRDLVPGLAGRLFRNKPLDDTREFWALQDVSFEVKRGEAFGVIGHNGAGKSTALKILSRIMRPTSGAMVVNGRLSALIEVTAGFHQDLTGRENIFLNGTILGMTKQEIQSRFDRIVAFSGLEAFIDTPVKRYSSGMYARLGFSVAAHVNPEVLIVDEVLSVGDFVFQNRCIERMKEVVREGAAVLLVSHNLKTVAEFCHRCVLLDHGRVVTIGSPSEAIRAYMGSMRGTVERDESKPVFVSRVEMRNRQGENIRFESGETVWVDIAVTARQRCEKLAVVLNMMDDTAYSVFNTSTERLGLGNFDLDAGETYVCSFELRLNLANGMFRHEAIVYRYDTQTHYDSSDLGGGFYVGTADDIRGAANCFPKVVRQEILKAGKTAPGEVDDPVPAAMSACGSQ